MPPRHEERLAYRELQAREGGGRAPPRATCSRRRPRAVRRCPRWRRRVGATRRAREAERSSSLRLRASRSRLKATRPAAITRRPAMRRFPIAALVARHDAVTARWLAYETDAATALSLPADARRRSIRPPSRSCARSATRRRCAPRRPQASVSPRDLSRLPGCGPGRRVDIRRRRGAMRAARCARALPGLPLGAARTAGRMAAARRRCASSEAARVVAEVARRRSRRERERHRRRAPRADGA